MPLADGSGLQAELDRELHRTHPLSAARPAVFGRCLVCNDVVASVANPIELREQEERHLHLGTLASRS